MSLPISIAETLLSSFGVVARVKRDVKQVQALLSGPT